MVPPNFAGDDYHDASSNYSGKMQQLATASGDDDGTIDSTTLTTAKLGGPGHDNSTGDAATEVLSGNERVFAAIAADPTAPPWASPFAAGLLNLFDNLSANSTA